MKVNIFNINGERAGSVTLDNQVYKVEPNAGAIRQSVLAELTNMRQGTHSSKNRSAVRGGGKNHGSKKVGALPELALFVLLVKGGGVVFGPSPHKYSHKLSRKLSRLARKSLLSIKFSEKMLVSLIFLKLKITKLHLQSN